MAAKNPHRLKETPLVIFILSIFLCVAFYDIVFLGKTFKVSVANPQALMSGPYGQEGNKLAYFPVHSTDACLFEEPIYEFIKQSLKKGIFPFWNPHQACGYPLIALMNIGFFWPLHFILYLLPNIYSWDIMLLCRLLLAGLFTYWFMRGMRFGKIPAFGAGLAFALSGPMILSQWAFVNVDIITPLILLSMERIIRKPHRKNACLMAGSVFLMFLAGHAEHIFLVGVYAFLFFCFRLLTVKPRPSFRKVIACLAGGSILGTGLSAFVLFPFLRNWHTEIWHTHPNYLGALTEASGIAREALVTLVMPYFFQKEIVTLDFSRYAFWGHIGVVCFGLAFLGLLSCQRRGLNIFLAFLAFVLFAKSHLNISWINWIGSLPLFRIVRFYHHTSHLFAFTIAVLAGMGLRVVMAKRSVLIRGGLFGALLLWAGGKALFFYREAEHFPRSLEAGMWALGVLVIFEIILLIRNRQWLSKRYCAVLLILVLFGEIFLYIPHERARRFDSFPKVPYISFIKNMPQRTRAYGVFWTLYPNTASGYGIDDLGVVHGVMYKRFVKFVNHFLIADYFKKDSRKTSFNVVPVTFFGQYRPFLDMLNIKYTAAPKRLKRIFPPAGAPNFPKPVYDNEAKVFESKTALPRAFVVHRALFEPQEEGVVRAMKRQKQNFRVMAVIHHKNIPEITERLGKIPPIDTSRVKIIRYAPNEVVIEADMEYAGFLVLGDSYHPDWKAFADGKPTPVYITNYLARSVFLEAGKHTVRFSFQPASFYFGALLSLLSLGVVIGLLKRKRPAGHPSRNPCP